MCRSSLSTSVSEEKDSYVGSLLIKTEVRMLGKQGEWYMIEVNGGSF